MITVTVESTDAYILHEAFATSIALALTRAMFGQPSRNFAPTDGIEVVLTDSAGTTRHVWQPDEVIA